MNILKSKCLATASLLAEDIWVTAKTKIALASDGRVKGSQISVETNDGVVKLRGKVDSEDARVASTTIAKAIDGTKSVKNDLQVVAPSQRDDIEDSDEAITARVKELIEKDAYVMKHSSLKHVKIGVVTNAGVVSLTGEVNSLLVSAQASWTAWQIAGVKSVKNDLIIVND
jgi:hyperosmotically inducible periplasmic protein